MRGGSLIIIHGLLFLLAVKLTTAPSPSYVESRKRRILLLGMPNSGVSLLAYTLAGAVPGSIVIPLHPGATPPEPRELKDVGRSPPLPATSPHRPKGVGSLIILRALLHPNVTLPKLVTTFRPDASVLCLRHPAINYYSLEKDAARDYSLHVTAASNSSSSSFASSSPSSPSSFDAADIDSRFRALERLFLVRHRAFNTTVHYEDLVPLPRPVLRFKLQRVGISSREIHRALEPPYLQQTKRAKEIHSTSRDPWHGVFKGWSSSRHRQEQEQEDSIRNRKPRHIMAVPILPVHQHTMASCSWCAQHVNMTLPAAGSTSIDTALPKLLVFNGTGRVIFPSSEALLGVDRRRARLLQLVPTLSLTYRQLFPDLPSFFSPTPPLADSESITTSGQSTRSRVRKSAASYLSHREELYFMSEELLELVELRASKDRIIVLTFADNSWVHMVLNFAANLEAIGVNHYVILSLEAELHTFLIDHAAPSFYYTAMELRDLRKRMQHLQRESMMPRRGEEGQRLSSGSNGESGTNPRRLWANLGNITAENHPMTANESEDLHTHLEHHHRGNRRINDDKAALSSGTGASNSDTLLTGSASSLSTAPLPSIAPVERRALALDSLGNQFRSRLWYHRWRLMGAVLRAGFHIVHSDADAIWLSDPTDFLRSVPASIVAGRGANKEDWLICMGFIFLESSPAIRDRFLPNFLHRIRQLGDDQRALNTVLRDPPFNLTWDRNPLKPHPRHRRSSSSQGAFDQIYVGATSPGDSISTSSLRETTLSTSASSSSFSVLLLPNSVIRRFFCDATSRRSTLFVLHCRDVRVREPLSTKDEEHSAPKQFWNLSKPKVKPSNLSLATNVTLTLESFAALTNTIKKSMTQGESAADKSEGGKLLGVWRLVQSWNTKPFPAAPRGYNNLTRALIDDSIPTKPGYESQKNKAAVLGPFDFSYYDISPWMRLRQSNFGRPKSSKSSHTELDSAFQKWIRSVMTHP